MTRICAKCKTEKSVDDFYSYKTRLRHWCKSCDKEYTILRQSLFKELCIEYKGGKCEKCGYNKYIGALQFHHKDTAQKDFEISKAKLKKFDTQVKKELDKCELLCANCHSETHNVYDIDKLKKKWVSYKEQKAQLKNITENKCFCGNSKSKQSKQCLKCANKKSLERNVDDVISKIKETNWTQAGKFFGVSDNALRKFLRKNKIDIDNLKQ